MPLDFSPVAPVYDFLNDAISLGLHRHWKRRLVRELVSVSPTAEKVADIAAGTGDVAQLLAHKAGLSVFAVEPCAAMLARGRNRLLRNVTWLMANSEALPLANESVQGLTCSFGVRNFTNRPQAFAEWARVVRRGGVCAVLEIHPPRPGWFKRILDFYWNVTMPFAGRLFGRAKEYAYLRDSVMNFVSPEQLGEEARRAGLEPLRVISLFGKGMVSLSLFRNHGRKT